MQPFCPERMHRQWRHEAVPGRPGTDVRLNGISFAEGLKHCIRVNDLAVPAAGTQ